MEVLPFRVESIVLEHKSLLMGPHIAFRVVHRVLMHRLLAYNFTVESGLELVFLHRFDHRLLHIVYSISPV